MRSPKWFGGQLLPQVAVLPGNEPGRVTRPQARNQLRGASSSACSKACQDAGWAKAEVFGRPEHHVDPRDKTTQQVSGTARTSSSDRNQCGSIA